jgi:hypothetical protein
LPLGTLLWLLPSLSLAGLAVSEDPRSVAASPATEPQVIGSLSYGDSGFDCGGGYSLDILSDGTVRFDVNGGENPCRRVPEPRAKRKLPPAELAQVVAAFEKADLFGMQDEYRPSLDHGTTVSVVYARSSGTKRVTYQLGSMDPPPAAIYQLESRIHQILGARGWLRELREYWTYRCPPGSSTIVLGPCPAP